MCITSALIAPTPTRPPLSLPRGTRGTSHDSCARSRSNIACTDRRPNRAPGTRTPTSRSSFSVIAHSAAPAWDQSAALREPPGGAAAEPAAANGFSTVAAPAPKGEDGEVGFGADGCAFAATAGGRLGGKGAVGCGGAAGGTGAANGAAGARALGEAGGGASLYASVAAVSLWILEIDCVTPAVRPPHCSC